jgi:hypothetical protein
MPKQPSQRLRYTAVAKLPPVHLSNRGTSGSVLVETYKGGKFIGYFDIGGAGIKFTKTHARPSKGESKPRPTATLSWRKLAKKLDPSFDA